MVTVKLNGEEFPCPVERIKTLGDLLELVKASIDADEVVVDLQIDGKVLTESDWRVPLSVQGNRVFEISTGPKSEYVSARLVVAPDIYEKVCNEFREARDHFRGGMSFSGNAALSRSVGDLSAFLSWYQSVLEISSDELQMVLAEFQVCVDDIRGVCEELVQQQLCQSWSALGDTMEVRLEPALHRLGVVCQRASQDAIE